MVEGIGDTRKKAMDMLQETENLSLDTNTEYADFKEIVVTKVDETKPWKPALEVEVTKSDGSKEVIPANTPVFKIKDKDGNEIIMNIESANHVTDRHIHKNDIGSKFYYPNVKDLMEDIYSNIPVEIASNSEKSEVSIDMGKIIGTETVSSKEELKEKGIITDEDINTVEAYRTEVADLNRGGENTRDAKELFVNVFNRDHPDCKIQFSVLNNGVLLPVVKSTPQETSEIFMVIGNNDEKGRSFRTLTPGRYMPKFPDPKSHYTNENNMFDEEGYKKSEEAWFDTVMLVD